MIHDAGERSRASVYETSSADLNTEDALLRCTFGFKGFVLLVSLFSLRHTKMKFKSFYP